MSDMKRKKSRKNMSDKTFDLILTIIVTAVLIAVLYPMIYVVSSSLSSGVAVSEGRVYLWPVDFSLYGYKWVLRNKLVWTGYKNTIIYTLGGTFVHLIMTICLAYPLSRRNYQAKGFVQRFLTASMMFGGGLIPTFILVSKLGLFNNPLYMIISGAVGISHAIMMRTNFQTNVPYELLESAKMDGISDYGYLIKIVLPLSKAILSVICLYCMVGKWNAYMGPLIYLREREYYPLALILNEMLNQTKMNMGEMSNGEQGQVEEALLAETQKSLDGIKYALIMVSIIPMLALYPFVQKFFEKGVTVGSIKG
jgi:ABC-type glycerol-3-phosphate transport system permease component